MVSSRSSARERLKAIAVRAMRARNLLPEFSAPAAREAAAMREVPPVAGESLHDFRARLWCSIDNDESRDLDQLTVAEEGEGGLVTILVAIADVDALVPVGSALDEHAAANTTSVYTAAQVFPMLPEHLSTDLTSLSEGHDRAAVVISMAISPGGEMLRSDVMRGVVRNRAKLAYGGVAAWLAGEAPAPAALARVAGMDEQLRLQARVAQAMGALRHTHGALSLETVEARPIFEADKVTDLEPEVDNAAKQLIADFMIGANAAVVAFLRTRGFASMRRVLRTPARWDRIAALAKELGDRLPDAPDGQLLEQFLARRRAADPASFADLSLSIVKLLGRGEYVAQPAGSADVGHFGLALKDYSHATAPNRRFPDLVTQRLIKMALAGGPSPYPLGELQALALHCTTQEDSAAKVERQVRKSAAALLLESRLGERFDAVVTGVTSAGTWVRIGRPVVEGMLIRGGSVDVGDRLRVALVSVDAERGFIDFMPEGRPR